MNEIELKSLWKSTQDQLNALAAINKNNTETITSMQFNHVLASMKPIKLFTLGVGLVWSFIAGGLVVYLFLFAYDSVSLFFLYSAAIQVILTILTIIVYIYQLHLIYYGIDYSSPVLDTQEKLSKLRASTLWIARIQFLQLPVWTTFYLSEDLFVKENLFFLIIQGLVTAFMVFASIWLFMHIRIENKDKKWFKWIFNGAEWEPILKAMGLLEEIKAFKEQ